MILTGQLKAAARESGADLVGVADLSPFKADRSVPRRDALGQFASAVAIAVRLDDAIMDGIDRAPTPDYVRHYREVNAKLDTITARLAEWIRRRGFSASEILASQTVDSVNQLGQISHKAVARMAGIGWQGKSLLIVSPQFGPRIRLATLLTDLPLSADAPLKNRCGTCAECATACPASAIKNVGTKDGYESREEALWFERCVEQTLRFKADPAIASQVCGVCVKVCPFGRGRHANAIRATAGERLLKLREKAATAGFETD